MVKRLLLLMLLLLPVHLYAYESAQGWCEKGGIKVATGGLTSTTNVQASYATCTVTVYVSGTVTPATIYSDNAATPTPIPGASFTATSTGHWQFYAANGAYDVVLSGGSPTPGISPPFTLSALIIGDAAQDCSKFPGPTDGEKWSQCFSALPTTGGIADASLMTGVRGISTADPFSGVSKNITLIISGQYVQSVPAVTVRSNFTIEFAQSGSFSVNNGSTLTFQLGSTISAGNSKIVDGAGTVDLRVPHVNAYWTGAIFDNVADDTAALTKLFAWTYDGAEIALPPTPASVNCATGFTITKRLLMVGSNNQVSGFKCNSAGSGGTAFTITGAPVTFKHFFVKNNNNASVGVEINANLFTAEDVRVGAFGSVGFDAAAFRLGDSVDRNTITFRDTYTDYDLVGYDIRRGNAINLDNIFSVNNWTGVRVGSSAVVSSLTIMGTSKMQVVGTPYFGSPATAVDVDLQNVNGASIIGNYFETNNNATPGVSGQLAINITSNVTGLVIGGNYFIDGGCATCSNYAINVASTAHAIHILPNYFRNYVVAAVQVGGGSANTELVLDRQYLSGGIPVTASPSQPSFDAQLQRSINLKSFSGTATVGENLRGTCSISGNAATSCTVTFGTAEPDANYYTAVSACDSAGGAATASLRLHGQSRTVNGFSIVGEAAPGVGATVTACWLLIR